MPCTVRKSGTQIKKRVIISFALVLVLFFLTSCDNRIHSANENTPVSTQDSKLATVVKTPAEVNPSESEISALEQAKLSFEQLRQTALETLGDDKGFQNNLLRFLINYSSDTILLATLVRYPDLGNDIYNGKSAENRYRVMEVAVCDYKLKGISLVEGGCTIVPILVKVKKSTDQVQEVTIPELHDLEKRKQDINDIFGVESEEELRLSTSECDEKTKERIWRGHKNMLSSYKYQIASEGGFAGFENGIIGIYDEIKDNTSFDTSTEDGTIRAYFFKNEFSYDMLCVPYWHELGRESADDGTTTLYLVTYKINIYAAEEGTLAASEAWEVGALKLKKDGAQFQVKEYNYLSNPDIEETDEMDACIGKFTPIYNNFILSQEYSQWLSGCKEKTDEIMSGVYDFSNLQWN